MIEQKSIVILTKILCESKYIEERHKILFGFVFVFAFAFSMLVR